MKKGQTNTSKAGDNYTEQSENFIKGFWEARRLTQKSMLNESEQAYQKVAAEARDNGMIAESFVAEAAISELKGRYNDAIRLLEHVVKSASGAIKGVAYFMLGSSYKERLQESFEDSERSYQEALKVEEFGKKAWVYNNLGNIYFRKATLLKSKDPNKQEWFKLAQENYEKSIAISDDSTSYITIYNQGRLALAEDNYDDAIHKFGLTIDVVGDDLDLHGCCYREIGTAYILKAIASDGQAFHDAIRCWENASRMFERAELSAGEDVGRLGKSAVVLAKIRVAKHYRDRLNEIVGDDKVLLTWWPPEESGADGYSTPEERIFSMIEATGRDRYKVYNTRSSSRFAARKKDNNVIRSKNVLAVLRGWGSASPLIEDALSACVGGGYFLKWLDKGIVIDPGIDFMRNFRASGFHMREVDAVIVSHNHTDHNADLRAIDDVFYEMYKRSDEDVRGDIDRNWHYFLICDEQTKAKDFLREHGGAVGSTANNISRHRNNVSHRTTLDIKDQQSENGEYVLNFRDKGLPFVIHCVKAIHNVPAYSLRIDCLSEDGKSAFQVGFTCDTEYYPELGNHFKDEKKCDILVAHVSQPDLVELLSNNVLKRNHLGYRGVARLIKECEPGLTVLGEFWAGFADMRIDITKGLKRICADAAILPSSVGLFISPQEHHHDHESEKILEVECSNCRKWRSVSSIYIGSASNEFGPLAYLCSLCRI